MQVNLVVTGEIMTEPKVQAAEQVAQQVAQDIAEAVQNAKQAAQQLQEAIGQTQRAVVDASRTARSQEIGAESEFETGSDEFFKKSSQGSALFSDMIVLNAKRTYDEFQHESLTDVRETRELFQRLAQNAVSHDENIQNVSLQALQNAVETANMVGKQAVRHGDIAIDRQWNVDEQGYTVAEILRDEAFKEAIVAAVAKAAQGKPTT